MQKISDICNRLNLPVTPDPAPELPKAAGRANPVPPTPPASLNSASSSALTGNGPSAPEPLTAAGSPPGDRMRFTIARLWRRMAAIYSHRWTSSYGEAIDADGRLTDTGQCWADGLHDLSLADLKRGLHRCVHERADPWPPTLPEFRYLCQPTPEELGLPTVEEAYRVACLQQPDWLGVHPLVWHARLAVGVFELLSEPASRTRPRFEAVYQALVRRALVGERFTFPAALTAPALPYQSQSLSEEERAEAQRWALDLSQMADPEARQTALASAPAHWQPTIRHYLAWRLHMAALREHLPGLRAAPAVPPARATPYPPPRSGD